MPSVLGYIPSGSRCGNVPNELVHRAGPPFLDNHYRGYQYIYIMDQPSKRCRSLQRRLLCVSKALERSQRATEATEPGRINHLGTELVHAREAKLAFAN